MGKLVNKLYSELPGEYLIEKDDEELLYRTRPVRSIEKLKPKLEYNLQRSDSFLKLALDAKDLNNSTNKLLQT